jgi:hypothetical protein
MKPLRWWAVVVLVVGSTAWSQQGAAPDMGSVESERLRIDTTRQQKIAELDVEESACSAKFAVTDCQNKVNARRRQLLSDLKRQEASLNAIERRQKGLDQLRRAEEKAADSAARRQELQTAPGGAAQSDRKKAQDEKILNHQQQANPVGGQPPAGKSTSALNPAEVDANRAAYAEKQNALEKRRKDRDQLLLDKGAGGPPLPVAP